MWKIAIIDDDQKVLRGMKKIIPWSDLGVEFVGQAENGNEGLELIRTVRPDIVITDIYMPVMNGLEMLQELSNTDVSSKIVILSGYADFEYARQAVSLNVSDYLVKPISVDTLTHVLKKVITQLEAEQKDKIERNELLDTTNVYRPLIEREFLKSLITGTFHPHFHKLREEQTVILTERKFQTLIIEIEKFKRLFDASASDVHLLRYAVANVLEELLQTHWPESNVLELYSRHIAILLRYPPDKDPAQLSDLCQLLIGNIRHYLDVSIRIGIGAEHEAKMIARSTEEAFSALYTMRGAAKEDISVKIWDPDSTQFQNSVRFHRVKYYQNVAEAIRQLQQQQAITLIKEFTAEWLNIDATDPDDVHRVATEFWGIFAYALSEAGYSLDELFQDVLVKAEISLLHTPLQFSEWIEHKIRSICQRLDGNGVNIKHKQAVDVVVQYIHEHYAEDIRLGDMADIVYLSRNYLSTLFHSVIGETFQEYIIKVRMENAKRLILEGKYRIYEVADMVGYRNVPYFTSMFKKFVGKNPTDLLKKPMSAKK